MNIRKSITAIALVALCMALAIVACRRTEAPAPKEVEPEGPQYDDADRLGLKDAPWIGAMNAPVTIVEFSSYQCPFCGRVQPTLKKLLAEFPEDIRLVYKHHPLPNQVNAGPAAEAAIEAQAQGKFWEFHDKLLENQRAISRPDLEKHAEALGMDMDRFRKALDDGIHKERIQKDLATAAAAGIRGTPNFLINGKNVVGARPFEDFAAVVREEIEATRKLMADGKSLGAAFGERVTTNLAARPAPPERPAEPTGPVDIKVGDSIAMGPTNAKVVLVEFSDFKCGFCGRLFNTILEVKDDYKETVLFVKKQFPLGRWPESEKAAQATLAAHAQGKHDAFAKLIYENQRTFDDAMLADFAKQAGLNVKRFKKEMDEGIWAEQVKKDQADGRAIGVRGTPALYLNGMKIGGALPAERLREALDKALAEAK